MNTPRRVDKVAGKEKQQGEIRKVEEENRMGKMVGLREQGAWTRGESMDNRKIKWSDWWSNDVAVKFLIRSVYDILPSPVNLHLWKKKNPRVRYAGVLDH